MRTKKAIKGTIIEIIPTIIIALLGLFKTKVFIEYLGSSMNGYFQFINQFISYLFLAEAGFSTAITYKLYKPTEKKDYNKISELYYGGLKIFHRIGLIISAGVLLLCIFFNFYIHDTNSIKLIVIVSFILISLSNILAYFFYSKMYQALYASNQEIYKASLITNAFKILTEIALIIIPIYFPSLLLVAVITFIFKILEEIAFIIISKKRFNYIKKVPPEKYDTSAYKMTKDLIFSQIGYIAFNNIDIVIIMGFPALGAIAVSIYSTYNYISKFVFSLIAKISSVSLHILGNVFVKDEKEHSIGIFHEYLSFSFIIATICSLTFLIGARGFVQIWIKDSSYILNTYTICAFSMILFLSIAMEPLTNIIAANGLFKESKYYTLISSVVNLVLSILLCYFWGILGVLIATIISYILDITFRSRLVIKKVFPEIGLKKILNLYLIPFIIMLFLTILSTILENKFLIFSTNYLKFFIGIIIALVSISILVLTIYYITYKSTRDLFQRGRRLLKK